MLNDDEYDDEEYDDEEYDDEEEGEEEDDDEYDDGPSKKPLLIVMLLAAAALVCIGLAVVLLNGDKDGGTPTADDTPATEGVDKPAEGGSADPLAELELGSDLLDFGLDDEPLGDAPPAATPAPAADPVKETSSDALAAATPLPRKDPVVADDPFEDELRIIERQPDPTPEPRRDPDPTPEPERQPDPTPEPEPDPTPEPEPDPTPEPEPDPTPESDPTPEPEAAADPTPEPEAEPTPAPAPALDMSYEKDYLASLVPQANAGTLGEQEIAHLKSAASNDPQYLNAMSILVANFEKKKDSKAQCGIAKDVTDQGRYKYNPEWTLQLAKCNLRNGQLESAIQNADTTISYQSDLSSKARASRVILAYQIKARARTSIYEADAKKNSGFGNEQFLVRAIAAWQEVRNYAQGVGSQRNVDLANREMEDLEQRRAPKD